jgi:peptide chain release factor 2
MDDIIQSFDELGQAIAKATSQVKLELLLSEASQLEQQVSDPTFWNDQQHAQLVTKQIAKLKARVEPWLEIQQIVAESKELAEMGDESVKQDLEATLFEQQNKFDLLRHQLLFSGTYDDHDVIMSIHAGAGGTDAQDWAEMLQRMYLRWTEAHPEMTSVIIEQSNGEEAGIKSVTFEISGVLAYGKLKGEAGVHRLVRLSPFNSDNLRQTSFAKVEVMPKIEQPDEVEIDEKDLKIDVYRAGGHGGQSVNTTDSAVRITHTPTNIVVAIQNERSQLQNKETAMTILRSKLASLQLEQHKEKISELKGPNEQAAWGNQIRSYVLHPYSMVKDLRTRYETSDTQGVLDGKLDEFMNAYLEWYVGQKEA